MMARFSVDCRLCPRLARHLDHVRAECPGYHARPVPPFGVEQPRLLVVGLAPGLHGANRTGRPFTGDHAGILLYETLHGFGFANRAVSTGVRDGLALRQCRVTNAVKCLPPQNKPTAAEVARCNSYLRDEIAELTSGAAILALGVVAHDAVLRALGMRRAALRFRHGARHALPHGLTLYDSYHCSRYNTQTKRLTRDMFRSVFTDIAAHLAAGRP